MLKSSKVPSLDWLLHCSAEDDGVEDNGVETLRMVVVLWTKCVCERCRDGEKLGLIFLARSLLENATHK